MRWRKLWRRSRRFVVHNVLHADDPPGRLAMGVAIGVFVTFTPTVGFQMMLVLLLAWLMRANKVVGLPIVWLSNPATIVPIFYGCYLLGVWMMGAQSIGSQWWEALYHPPDGWWSTVTFYWDRLLEVAVPLWLGCIVVGLALAYPSYYATYFVVRSYRLRRWGQLVPPTPAQRALAAEQQAEQAERAEKVGEARPSEPTHSDAGDATTAAPPPKHLSADRRAAEARP